MSYIGSTPTSQAFAPGTDTFSGTGSQVAFTLSRNVATVNDILVVVNNVDQQPTAYSVASNVLTFTAAPSSGTNNIYVRYLSTNLQTIAPQQGSVYPSSLSTQNALYWDTSGNVGIGTTSPSTYGKLAVTTPGGAGLASITNSDGGGTNGGMQLASYYGAVKVGYYNINLTNGTLGAETSYASLATIGAGALVERMRIDSSGNVGIGNTSPSFKLDIAAGALGTTAGSTVSYQRLYSYTANGDYFEITNTRQVAGSSWVGAGTRLQQKVDASWMGYIQFNGGSGTTNDGGISFGTGITTTSSVSIPEVMRIDSSGNVLINTTAMPSGYSKLAFRCNGDGSTWQNLGATGASAPTTLAFLNSSGTRVGYIAQSGTATAFTSTSDYRLKEDVQPMVGALDKVAQLRPVTYKWKSTGGDGQGFIAHELQTVVPDCVNGEKDAVDADGNPNYQGVDTSFLVATLTAAIQEQQAMIEELKTKVAALEAR